MNHTVVAPSVGESITEVSILKWAKADGDYVENGELLLEIESDKATVEVVAPASGQLKIVTPEGETIPVGEEIGSIDDSVGGDTAKAKPKASEPARAAAEQSAVAANAGGAAPISTPSPSGATPGPAARKMATEKGVDVSQVAGTGKDGRVTKGDVIEHVSRSPGLQSNGSAPAPAATKAPAPAAPKAKDRPGDRRVKMSRLRMKIAENLVNVQHTAAILTTFNEINMKPVMDLRNQYKEKFKAKNGVPLSFMSFFTKASVEALKEIPEVNASIDGGEIIYHDYYDIGIAVGTERGLVVPVIRNMDQVSFVEFEKNLAELALKARSGKLSIDDMTGGTFTISNGGTYGSMMSTPILNPPQSGILGMHNIVQRPMAVDGQVQILPMMYVALSYDHRIIDGKGAVTFLVRLKELIEQPQKLNLDFVNEL